MKSVYICGDSFGCPDLGWPITPWPTRLQTMLGRNYIVNNLSISCASNLIISLQVDRAIASKADYVILLCTSSTRSQGQIGTKKQYSDLLDRFVKIGTHDLDLKKRDLACYSLHSLDESCVFTPDYQVLISNYQSRLFDLDLEIYHNQCIIESMLNRLINNNTNFLFDQGGFENPIFGKVNQQKYFAEFDQYRSDINQWTIAAELPTVALTHFHILDESVHNNIANYYADKIIDVSITH